VPKSHSGSWASPPGGRRAALDPGPSRRGAPYRLRPGGQGYALYELAPHKVNLESRFLACWRRHDHTGRLFPGRACEVAQELAAGRGRPCPLCQAGFLALLFWFSGSRIRNFNPGFQFWLELNFVAWNLVIMPIVVALICELSWEQERDARTWNLLLIQPVPRRTHYLVKAFSHLSLVLMALALLAILLPSAASSSSANPNS